MIHVTPLDLLVGILLVVVTPVWGVWDFQTLRRAAARGEPEARVRSYRHGVLLAWAVTGLVGAAWLTAGRGVSTLGIRPPESWPWTLVGLAVVGLLLVQLNGVRRSPETRRRLREAAGELEPFLPRTSREQRWFAALGVTAGVTEELLWRGALMAVLGVLTGPWVAAVGSSVAFGLAHVYQGPVGVVRSGVIGMALAALYLASGSLLAPIVVHAAIDVVNGRMAALALADAEAPVHAGSGALPVAGPG